MSASFPLAELPPGAGRAVDAFGTRVAVFNVAGELHAVADTCPHHGGPLSRGRVSGALLPSRPYEYDYAVDEPVLTCPWHGWEFFLRSGRALFDPRVRVPLYEARVEDEQVVLYDRPR